MSELKYLSDGRKVSVIGKINKTEYIVQEVFITDSGDEIPSGENFTAKSLHDTPVKSWKEREQEKIELKYNKAKYDIESICRELDAMKKERATHAKILKSNLRQIKEVKDLNLGILPDVLARNIKYVCGAGYNWYKVKSFDEFIKIRSDYDEGVKLISVHCKADKTLSYHVGSYSDGSGNSSEYKFFNKKCDLRGYLESKLKEYSDSNKLSLYMLDGISSYITVPKKLKDELIDKRVKEAEIVFQAELERITKERNETLSLKKESNY